MKIDNVEIDRQLESTACQRPNPYQRQLLNALVLLDEGRGWHGGEGKRTPFIRHKLFGRTTYCPEGALKACAIGSAEDSWPDDIRVLQKLNEAARKYGFVSAYMLSDSYGSTFADVKAMFLCAIELAAS